MQEITHNIALNLSQPNNFEYIHIMQGDYNAEKVIATLFDGNKLYTINAQKASLQGSTSDGGLILQDGITISADKHQVTFEITKEMSSCTGELTCNIVFSSDNQKKSTFPFIIKNTADITGRTPVSVLTTISDYVDRAEKAASDAEKTLKDKADKDHKHTKSDITDFPTLGTASSKDVATSGNASASQVVMGDDTRLSDARKASDVSEWAKASTKPTYTASEVGAYTKTETDIKLNDKANSSHTHGNGDITSLDAGKITSGTIDIARLPQGALDRLVKVADDTARFKLTTNDIQLGDTVQTLDNKKMYYVVDENKLSSADGYATYTADTATSVPWSGVTGKPSSYTPSSHTHTKSQISDFPTSLPANGGNSSTVNGHTVNSNVPANAKFTDTVYSHPTSSGNKHIPSGGSSGQILRWVADGTATWGSDNNTIYTTGTTSVSGLTKLYTGTGSATDGTMTQSAITSALNSKAPSSHTHDYLPLSGGTVNGAVTFGKSDSYGIFTSTDNYCSIGSSSKYFYRAYIKNVYANSFMIDSHFSLRPSSSSSTNSEYTDVSNSVWIHGLTIEDYYGSKKPGLLLRQGSNFFQVFPTSNTSSAGTDIGHSSYKFRNIVGRTLYSDSGTVSTSDRNLKHDITNLSDEIVEKIVDGLIPKSFKFFI